MLAKRAKAFIFHLSTFRFDGVAKDKSRKRPRIATKKRTAAVRSIRTRMIAYLFSHSSFCLLMKSWSSFSRSSGILLKAYFLRCLKKNKNTTRKTIMPITLNKPDENRRVLNTVCATIGAASTMHLLKAEGFSNLTSE